MNHPLTLTAARLRHQAAAIQTTIDASAPPPADQATLQAAITTMTASADQIEAHIGTMKAAFDTAMRASVA